MSRDMDSLDGYRGFPDPSLAPIASGLERLTSLLTHIVTLSMKIGSFDDGPQLRENIQTDVRSILSSSQTVKSTLQDLKSRAVPGVDEYLAQFDSIRARMQRELPDVISKLRNTVSSPRSPWDARDDSMSQPLLDQAQLDAESGYMDVLEQNVNRIVNTMREVHQLFTDTLTEIQQQRHLVTGIETLTSKAVDDMNNGNKQLEQADEKQKSSTKCLCCIVTILSLVVVGVVLVILYFEVWHKKKTN
jgi:hypothetical protein